LKTRDDTTGLATPSRDETLPAGEVKQGGALHPPGEDMPARLGRYCIERRLGAGGMGVVYAAHDPELDRTVAIKLVRERSSVFTHRLQDRLRREAQALARLSHPNVVSVYDVGFEGAHLFIVMQYVDGVPLDAWLDKHQPDRARIVAMFVQAGRGLAAAHAAGLVHRDFKPSNVLVEADGTVHVTDFGLARLSDLAEPSGSGTGGTSLGISMTRGDAVGTPAYMAPEQFLGGPVTDATDQFAFCVALWEALTGTRPFPGSDVDTIRGAVLEGTITPERARGMPRGIERLLRRGLAVSASDRFPSMRALLDSLAPPRRTTRMAVVALAVGAAAAGVPFLVADRGTPPCTDTTADLASVWSPSVSAEVHAALAGLPVPDAPAFADAVVARLGAHADRWRAMKIDTCEASRVRKTDDAAITVRRTACLARSLDGLRAAISLARTGDAVTKSNILAALGAGTAPSECTAAGTDQGWAAPASSALSQRLAEVEAARAVGRSPFVLANAPSLAAELEAAGDLQGAARAYLALASSANQSNAAIRDSARKAAVLAAQAGDDFLEAKAWSTAAVVVAHDPAERTFEELIAMAEAAATRSGRATEARIGIEIARGRHELGVRDYDKAIASCKHALDAARTQQLRDGSKLELNALGCLADTYYYAERWPEAVQVSQTRLALARSLEGDTSGLTLECMRQAAIATMWSGKLDEGRAAMRDTIERETVVFGAESRHVLESWWRLAQAESHDGELASERGLEASQHAVAIATKVLGPEEIRRATIFMTHGDILSALGKTDESLAAYEGVLAVYDRVDNPKRWAPVAYNVADGYIRAGKCDRALPIVERIIALAGAGRVGGSLGPTATGLRGTCHAQAGKYAAALADFDQAIAQCDRIDEKEFAAQFRIEAGKAHAAAHEPAAAKRRFREVLEMFPKSDDPVHEQLRAEVTKLLNGG